MSTWQAGSFCLCCFWQIMRRLWSLHLSGIPHHKDSTMAGMSTWPAGSFCLCCFWKAARHLWSLHMSGIPHHMDLKPGRNIYLTSCFILSVLFWQIVICLLSLHVSGIPLHMDLHPGRNVYLTSWFILSVVFDRQLDICGPYTCPGSPVTRISTLVGMSTWPAGSFSLCCFWQALRRLWSLHMSRIPHHTNLHAGRNIYLTS